MAHMQTQLGHSLTSTPSSQTSASGSGSASPSALSKAWRKAPEILRKLQFPNSREYGAMILVIVEAPSIDACFLLMEIQMKILPAAATLA